MKLFWGGLAACLMLLAMATANPAAAKCYGDPDGQICQNVEGFLNGSGSPQAVDSTHPLPVNASVTVATVSHTQTSALAAKLVVKASSGALASFEVSADATLSAAAWWIMIYDATDVPADGAVTPAKCYAIPSGATAFTAGFPASVSFNTGITIGVSTDGCFAKVASTHAYIAADFQ